MVRRLLRAGYNRLLRPHVPVKIGVRNGVAVRGPYRLFDQYDHEPDHKEGLIEPIRQHVRGKDDVIVIGGGWGVGSVVAAQQTDGHVLVYEGAREMVEHCRDTHRLNNATENVEIVYGVVGPAIDVWGDESTAEVVAPNELPETDVLVIDVEGAEEEIITTLSHWPRVIIVEIHGQHGADAETIETTLTNRGYTLSRSDAVSPWDGHYAVTARRD